MANKPTTETKGEVIAGHVGIRKEQTKLRVKEDSFFLPEYFQMGEKRDWMGLRLKIQLLE